MVELLQRGDRIPLSQCQNVFEKVAFPLFPQLERYRRRFTLAGAGTVHLAGAGPTLFAPVDSREQGGDVCDKLRQDKLEVYLSQTLRINGE
jgi:4-diphosphocytidyl-2-C-methyl-D-erythritol kinase